MHKLITAGLMIVSTLFIMPVIANDEPSYRLNLIANDIQDVAFEGNTAWLKLTPSAAEDLRQITELNQGDWLDISVDGIEAMKIRIFGTVDSGVVEVSRPSPELRSILKDYQK